MQNGNHFTLTGKVQRTTKLEKGHIITLLNHRDYKKNDEWVNVGFFFPVVIFRDVDIVDGDIITVSGTLSMRPDPNDPEKKRSIVSLVVDTYDNPRVLAAMSEKSEKKESGKGEPKTEKTSARTTPKKPVATDDDDDLFN